MRTPRLIASLLLTLLWGCNIVDSPGNSFAGYQKTELDWKSFAYHYDSAFTAFFDERPAVFSLPETQWKSVPPSLSRFSADSSVWLRWSWDNPASRDADWTLEAPRMTHFQLYYQIDGEQHIRSASSGYLINASEQELIESRKSVVSLFIPQHAGKIHFWAHLASTDHKPIRPTFTFYPTKTWLRTLSLHNLVQGLFQGLFWIMIFYNLLIYFTSKDRTYLYYVGYMVGAAVYFLYYYHYLSSFLFRQSPITSSYVWVLSAHTAPIFFFLFTRRFLSTKQSFPLYDKVLRSWIGIRLVFLATLLAILYTAFNVNLIDQLITGFTVLEIIVVGGLIVQLFRSKKTAGYYYSIGVIGLWVGNALAILGNTGVIPKSGLYIEAGTSLEILLFSLGLGYRIRNNEKQKRKAQEDLIEQLRQNEELKDEANRKLEEKVVERTERINQQKEELAAQRDALETASQHLKKAFGNMSSSVNYARRIQQAMMVSPERVSEGFGSAFIINRPKDVLGGDLYWYYEDESAKVVILADCTGHGVPGALMTIVALSIFNNVVGKQRLYDPAAILYACDEELKSFFSREDKRNDGMDMAVLSLDCQTRRLSFEGAKLPLLHVTPQGEVHFTKGSRHPMGHLNRKVEKEFSTKEIPASAGDRLYLYSDGFQDQFGGEQDRKFMSKKLRQLLLRTSKIPLEEQEEHVGRVFDEWKGARSQTDDVLLIGIEMGEA